MFIYFLSNDSKQDAATIPTESIFIMELLQNRKFLITNKGTISKNTYGFADQYIYATKIYLLSIFSHSYNIVIDSGVGSPGYGKDFVDGLKATEFFPFQC